MIFNASYSSVNMCISEVASFNVSNFSNNFKPKPKTNKVNPTLNSSG